MRERDRKCQLILPALRANTASVRRYLSELSPEARAVVMVTGNTHFSLSVPGHTLVQERHRLVQHQARSGVLRQWKFGKCFYMVGKTPTPADWKERNQEKSTSWNFVWKIVCVCVWGGGMKGEEMVRERSYRSVVLKVGSRGPQWFVMHSQGIWMFLNILWQKWKKSQLEISKLYLLFSFYS